MFLFMPQICRHNKFTVEKAEDVLSFRPAPLAQPKKAFGSFAHHSSSTTTISRFEIRNWMTAFSTIVPNILIVPLATRVPMASRTRHTAEWCLREQDMKRSWSKRHRKLLKLGLILRSQWICYIRNWFWRRIFEDISPSVVLSCPLVFLSGSPFVIVF